MSSALDVERLRKEYTMHGLHRRDLASDPFGQFKAWFEEAVKTGGPHEPNAMNLATATPDGVPSVRVVLLKGFGPDGFLFFTNYGSRKGRHLAANPRAALNFHWSWLERQVAIEGDVSKVSREESEGYFRRRPLGSRYGALASQQSEVVEGRSQLERQLAEVQSRYGQDPPTPENWGGYRVRPYRFEFWQGRENRLHDRFIYLPAPGGGWRIQRLSP